MRDDACLHTSPDTLVTGGATSGTALSGESAAQHNARRCAAAPPTHLKQLGVITVVSMQVQGARPLVVLDVCAPAVVRADPLCLSLRRFMGGDLGAWCCLAQATAMGPVVSLEVAVRSQPHDGCGRGHGALCVVGVVVGGAGWAMPQARASLSRRWRIEGTRCCVRYRLPHLICACYVDQRHRRGSHRRDMLWML
jgi:hypothetical protein